LEQVKLFPEEVIDLEMAKSNGRWLLDLVDFPVPSFK
jgi:hypothetical protein